MVHLPRLRAHVHAQLSQLYEHAMSKLSPVLLTPTIQEFSQPNSQNSAIENRRQDGNVGNRECSEWRSHRSVSRKGDRSEIEIGIQTSDQRANCSVVRLRKDEGDLRTVIASERHATSPSDRSWGCREGG